MNDTIAAISTPPGQGAIAMIRVSGPDALVITGSIFLLSGKKSGKPFTDRKGIHHGWIHRGGKLIDEVVIYYHTAPNTYTGEDLTEICCHGSVYIQHEILKLLIDTGARIARPGEFTQRAFLNGKMDLTQAEAVADLISSSGAAAHQLALDQIRGGFAKELSSIRTDLLNFVTLIELELDFAEEDVEFADRTRLKVLIKSIIERITGLISSFELGNAIKTGIPVTIAGETNVGKSTLLNALLKDEKAIVSEIAGTTRDSIEDCIHLQGIEFRFIDTAGIRETTDKIETIGIDRSFRQIEKARIVLLVADASSEAQASLQWIQQISGRVRPDQKLIILVNKMDLDPSRARKYQDTIRTFFSDQLPVIAISAKNGTGLKELETLLPDLVNAHALQDATVVVTNARHYEALSKAQTALERTFMGLNMGTSGDFLSQDIREAMHYIGEITGQISTDEVLGNIFQHFCIGK